MSLVATDAIVLHAFDYLETSRILRLLTRDAGVLSVLAKGARRNRAKYGSAVDLFAEGEAQIYLKTGRDLHTLAAFDVSSTRLAIAENFDRFAAASAVAELVLRGGRDDPNALLYETVVDTLEKIANAIPVDLASEAIGGTWRIMAALGFTPSLDACVSCHTPIDPDAKVAFSHGPGGVLCDQCARSAPRRRILPPEARGAIRAWLDHKSATLPDPTSVRAHQRLLREFIQEHLGGDRPLRAFVSWETGGISSPSQWRE
jgi:DNA repair protein RecO (recombination protein O)